MLSTQTGLVFLIIMMPFLPGIVIAQEDQTTTENKPVLTNPASGNGTDLLVAGGGILSTIAVGVGALVKDRIDKKSVTKNIKGTDVDMANFVALMSKFFQYSYVYKNYTVAQIMDLPANANPMDKTTLGQAISTHANEWVNFVQQEYNVPRPQMSIASQSIVTATQSTTQPPATQDINSTTKTQEVKTPPTTTTTETGK
jgi:hypothetical protein